MDIFNDIWSLIQSILMHGGYWIIFVVTAMEAVPLVGSFVPGHALIILAGIFAKIGVLNVYLVISVSVFGAIVGDIVAFLLGRKYGYGFLIRFGKYFFLKEEHLERAKQVMVIHTGKTLIIGRFSPVTRALTPFLAGASGVHINRFWFFNIIGCILWAVSSVILGYIFGASYEFISQYLGRFILIATIISILMLWAYRFINNQKHIFFRYHFYTLMTSIASLYVFFKTFQDTISIDSPLAQLDVWVNIKMQQISNIDMTHAMYSISGVFNLSSVIVVSIILFTYLLIKKRYHDFFVGVLSLLSVGFIVGLLKQVVARVRPESAFEYLSDFSFPSGHSAFAIVICCFLMYLFMSRIKNLILRESLGLLCITTFLLVGFSRLYLGMHWLSDVVAGFSIGLFCFTLSILLVKFLQSVIGK
jgi:membrane protein DedA with SNARE-associated domain